MKRFNNNKGSMFVVLIIAMTVIASLGAVFVSMVASKQQGFALLVNGHRANMIARAGVEWAIRYAFDKQYNYDELKGATRPLNHDRPEEGSFTTSYDSGQDILTVDGTYQGITATIQLAKFSSYAKPSDVSSAQSPTSFKPVESQAGASVSVEPTGLIHLGVGAAGAFGAVWYGGSTTAGNCVNGICDFGSGFRAYFIFQFAPGSTGDGFTFAITNGANNTANSIGGDSNMGELMAYGGDSRVYSSGYINKFVDGLGNGLRPPKFAVEFDIYPNTSCPANSCGSNNRCDPSNEHMAYVFWGDDNRIGCQDDYTRWMSSFSFLANTVVYGTTGGGTTYLYRSTNNLTTGTTQPAWPAGKGSTVTESGVQWQECSWRRNTGYSWGEIVAPTSSNGYFFRESQFWNPTTGWPTTGWWEPDWSGCINSGAECNDNTAGWRNAYFYGSPALSVNYATNSRTYDDDKHTAGTGVDAGDSTSGAGPTNATSSSSYYTSPTNPATWLADRTSETTLNATYAYRMEVVRNRTAGTYRIRSWIVACNPTWSPSTAYAINDQVRPRVSNGYYYTAATTGTSGAAEPAWGENETVTDGTITWIRSARVWSASTTYDVGKQIRPSVNNGYYYTAWTTGTSGATEPAWSASGAVTDGTVTWVPVAMPVCNKYTNGSLGNVQSDYTVTSPTLDRTITLDATYNAAFNKFLFGWTTASGEATQKADVWKFRLTFKP